MGCDEKESRSFSVVVKRGITSYFFVLEIQIHACPGFGLIG